MNLISTSAAITAKDGFINLAGFTKLSEKVAKAIAGYDYNPVKSRKLKGGLVENTFHLHGYNLKQARVIAKTLKQIAGVQSAEASASKAKTGPAVLAVTVDASVNKTADKQIMTVLKDGAPPMPNGHYVVSAKAKSVDFNAAKQKAQDPTYLSRRALKIAERTKLSAAVRPLISTYAKGVLPAALQKEVDQAIGAIKAHLKAMTGQTKLVQGIRDDKKKAREAALEAAAAWFTANVGEGSVVKAAGMMGGSTVIVKLGDTYVSISPSDKAAFAKAKRAQ